MKKKILSLALALTMVFGSAAALPQSSIVEQTQITVSAASPTINATNVNLYALSDWAKEYISVPSSYNQKFQLKVSNAKKVTYSVVSGSSVTVSSSGLVEPKTTTWYWYGNIGYSYKLEGKEPTKVEVSVNYGKSVVRATADGKTFDVTVNVNDYSETYANKVMDDYIKKNITSSMTGVQKLRKIAEFIASYDYSASASGCTSMIVTKGGDCWASTATVIAMCKKLGIKAWARNGNKDPGAGSGHRNAMAYVDGKYYEVEAGYSGKAPRSYNVTERKSLFSIKYNSTYGGYEVYQYDGEKMPATLTIPKTINGNTIVAIGDDFCTMDSDLKKVVLPSTIKSIGKSAFNSCYNLESINIPASVTNIDSFAFTACNNLKEITGTNKTFKWANGGLIKNGKTLLFVPNAKTYTVPNTVTTIADYAFYYNKSIKTITIPSSVTSIGEGALAACESLEKIYIQGNKLKTLGDFVFAQDYKLGSVYIPDSVTTIGDYMNYYNTDSKTFKILCHDGTKILEYAKKNKIPYQIIDKSKEHIYTSAVTKKATCTTKGVRTYTCSLCGKTYTEEIAAIGHKWGKVTYTWSKDNKTCTATRVCQNDKSHKQTETVKTTSKVTKAATCTSKGTSTYTATFKNKAFSSQKKTVDIAAKAHKYSAWTTTSLNVSKGTSTQKRTCSVCKKVETKTVNGTVKRYAGSDRFATAALISNKNKSGMYTTANTVILASGMTFNDALAAVPLAKAYNAPLLLSAQRYIPTDTLNEIKRLKAKEIIVVNTNGAISNAAINTLKKSYKVTQITGKTCYETASKVATSLQAKIKSNTKGKTTIPDSIFFVVDDKFADALSVSPVAAIKGAPIIYVKSTGNLNSSTTNYLKNLKGKIKNVYIVGGTVAISTAVENKIKSALGVKSTVRFAGSDRYETCTKINTYFKSILKTNAVCIAKGLDFPDALAGGVFAANNAAPLFLADYRLYDPQTKYLKTKTVNKIYIFGGEVAVPTKLAQTIATASV